MAMSWYARSIDSGEDTCLLLACQAFHKGTTEKMIERAFRAALAEMGSHVACAKGPYSGAKVSI